MNPRSRIAAMAAIIVLLLPVATYVWQFGWRISGNHTRWSEFGSAMSGIYAPALTIATLAILVMQLRLQARMHRHERDQAFVQQARADIEFYVQRLDAVLSAQFTSASTVCDVLLEQFQPPSPLEFDSERLRTLAKEIDNTAPQVLALICAIQSILAGLSATQEPTYKVNFTSALQKLIAILGFETCVALEHYHRTRTENRLASSYYFSPQLAPHEA